MKRPYKLEVDEEMHGCSCCNQDAQYYVIIGPDGLGLGTSYAMAHKEDGEEMVDMLNDAYEAGLSARGAIDAVDEWNDTAADGELRLKPCPFCDGEAKIENAAEVGPNSYVVVCQNPMCMSSSQVRVAEKDDVTRLLTEAWNMRTDQINASYETTALQREVAK